MWEKTYIDENGVEQNLQDEDSKYADILPQEDYPTVVKPNRGVYVNSRPRDDEPTSESGTGRTLRGYTSAATPTGSRIDNSNYWTIGKLPTLEYGTFTAPTRDQNRIGALRSRASGAGLRDLRRQTQQAIQGASGLDPTMRRMTLKDALQGYGSGVSKIMGAADRIAQAQYEDEYGDKYKESLLNYTTGINKANLEYQAELQKLVYNAGLGPETDMHVMNYRKA